MRLLSSAVCECVDGNHCGDAVHFFWWCHCEWERIFTFFRIRRSSNALKARQSSMLLLIVCVFCRFGAALSSNKCQLMNFLMHSNYMYWTRSPTMVVIDWDTQKGKSSFGNAKGTKKSKKAYCCVNNVYFNTKCFPIDLPKDRSENSNKRIVLWLTQLHQTRDQLNISSFCLCVIENNDLTNCIRLENQCFFYRWIITEKWTPIIIIN